MPPRLQPSHYHHVNSSHRHGCSKSLALTIAALFAAQFTPAHAAVITKADNALNLNDPASWIGNVVSGASDIALWNSTVGSANTVSLGANLTWGGMQVLDPGGDVTINGPANTLTIAGDSGIDMGKATRNLTVNSNLTLGNSQSWNI